MHICNNQMDVRRYTKIYYNTFQLVWYSFSIQSLNSPGFEHTRGIDTKKNLSYFTRLHKDKTISRFRFSKDSLLHLTLSKSQTMSAIHRKISSDHGAIAFLLSLPNSEHAFPSFTGGRKIENE